MSSLFHALPPLPGSGAGNTREKIREPAAEFLGVAIVVIFGAGAGCQVILSTVPGVSAFQRGVSSSITDRHTYIKIHSRATCPSISDGRLVLP